MESANDPSFIQELRNKNLEKMEEKIKLLNQHLMLIKDIVNPSEIILSLYNKKKTTLEPFLCTFKDIQLQNYTIEIDEFDQRNPYADMLISDKISWFKLDHLPFDIEAMHKFKKNQISEAIIAAIHVEKLVIGTLTVYLQEDTPEKESPKTFSSIEKIAKFLSIIFENWQREYTQNFKQKQAELVIELSELTLATTKIQIILNSLFEKLKFMGKIHSIAFFAREFEKFSLVHGVEISTETINFYESKSLKIRELSYFNNPEIIHEPSIFATNNHQGLILPVGSTNLMLGFLLVISENNKKLSDSFVKFLRIIANQLFLAMQRRRLLDDIQTITHTSELSSFPVILLSKESKILYINSQSEKTFNLNHDEIIGATLNDVLQIEPNRVKSMENKVREVLENLIKNSLRIEIDTYETGQKDTRTFFVQLSPAINNLTGEYCVVSSLVDISEATRLQEVAEEYSARSKMYLNVLTHDIFNILFAIGGYWEFMKNDIPERHQKNIDKVAILVKRGTEIVQDIRVLSSLFDTSIKEEITLIPLRMTLITVIEKLKMEKVPINLVINNHIPNSIRIAGGTYLSYIFEYILTNIIQEATAENITIDLKGEEKTSNKKACYELRIVEHGALNQKNIEKVQRVIKSTSIKDEPTKIIWLEVVKEIAKRYKYNLEFTETKIDENKKGTVYTISMPMKIS